MLFAGHGGRVTSGMSLSAYVVKNLALEMKDDSHPREAILKHAKVNYKRKHNTDEKKIRQVLYTVEVLSATTHATTHVQVSRHFYCDDPHETQFILSIKI